MFKRQRDIKYLRGLYIRQLEEEGKLADWMRIKSPLTKMAYNYVNSKQPWYWRLTYRLVRVGSTLIAWISNLYMFYLVYNLSNAIDSMIH